MDTLNLDTATAYVQAHFDRYDDMTMFAITHTAWCDADGDCPMVDVEFDYMIPDDAAIYTASMGVWIESDGSLYGEW